MTDRNLQDIDDPRVVRASREYLVELEAGRQPNRELYFQRDPDLESTLSEVFDGIELAQILLPKQKFPVESIAEPLGDFRILREIGRGGMGVVYEAIQLSLARKVALKVLPFSAALDARQRQRFLIESQAAALLHHTNIVPIYGVGCERGLHFYAMQLIEGGSLADVIYERKTAGNRQDHVLATTTATRGAMHNTQNSKDTQKVSRLPRAQRSSMRAIVELIAKVADALGYAHQAGTIHRDIKPANLLIDHTGNIWITDFGLAHVAADVSLTMTGDVLGTMRYMSPEQAGGQRAVLDNRTDIYSLGATLYELLTLEPVFGSTARQALLHEILNEDAKPLRQWNRSIPVELETIVLKCLSKSPGDRYSTAGDLAADLRRFLEERPILARRPTLIDTTRKWFRRHPSFLVAGAVVLISGMIGLGITTGIVASQQRLTWQSLERERERALEAEARFQLARRAADDMIRIAQNDLSDAPFQDGPRKRLLEEALRYYQEFIELRRDTPEAQTELAETRDRVAAILADLSVLEAGRHNILLREPAVLDDLGVSPEQRAQIAEHCAEIELRLRNQLPHHLGGTSGIPQDMLKFARGKNAAFSAILSPDQTARLRQISLQCVGPKVFFESEIASALELTDTQKFRIRRLKQEWIFGRSESKQQRNMFGPPDAEMLRQGLNAILPVLTSEQQARWKILIGKPYLGPISMPPGGPPFPLP